MIIDGKKNLIRLKNAFIIHNIFRDRLFPELFFSFSGSKKKMFLIKKTNMH